MPIPEKIGRYLIKTELGRGGMATVYRGFDPSFDREVAIKVLPREMLHDPQFRARFEREIKMVAALEHSSIVPVYDVGDEDGQPYFVMRYMSGGSLSDRIEKGKIPLEDTAKIVERIAQGLAYSHRKGIVHRDLKPDNILFDENGIPFISDFGIAKLTEAGGGLTGSGVIGTPAYMSPEQAQGNDVDGRSDVYGLGVIIYQMLSGQQPYSADTPMGVVVKHITEPVPEILKLIPSLPPEADEIIKTAMAKDREKRYPNPIDLAKALNMLAFGHEGDIKYPTNPNMTRVGNLGGVPLSPAMRTGALVAAGVIVVAIIGFFLLRNQLTAPAPEIATSEPTEEVTAPAATEVMTEAAPEFAPFCSEDVAFSTPDVVETNSRCIQKKPYINVSVPVGLTPEPLDPAITCTLAAANNNGVDVYSCGGTDFLVAQIKVCDPPELSSDDLGKCSADSTFNAEGACCVDVPPEDAGCTTIEVTFKGCN